MSLILIVDDDEMMLRALWRLLKSVGHEVTAFASTSAALSCTVRPDLALLDINLQGDSSGPEVARCYRARWPDLPVVFISGGAPRREMEAAQALGPVLRKPVLPADLLAMIGDMITASNS